MLFCLAFHGFKLLQQVLCPLKPFPSWKRESLHLSSHFNRLRAHLAVSVPVTGRVNLTRKGMDSQLPLVTKQQRVTTEELRHSHSITRGWSLAKDELRKTPTAGVLHPPSPSCVMEISRLHQSTPLGRLRAARNLISVSGPVMDTPCH